MAKFQYRALKNKKEFIEGEIEASTLREARQKIVALGFLPTKVYEENSMQDKLVEPTQTAPTTGKRVKRLSLNEKIWFTSELETLLSAGIPILEALESVQKNSASLKIKTICTNVIQSIYSGNTFAQSMEKLYAKVFGQVYIGLIKAGESSGELDETLIRMLVILNKEAKILDKVKSASIYPSILLAMMFGLIMLFSVVVFPRFCTFFSSTGGDIPLFAQVVFGFCDFVHKFWLFLIVGIVGVITGLHSLMQTYSFKKNIDMIVLKIPKLSEFINYINLANYMTVLYISYEAGVPIVSALELAQKTVGNIIIKSKLSNVVNMVKNGKSLAEALNFSQVIPSALLSMIATGEKSGSLGKMLKETVDVIDKKIDFVLDALSKAFEPTIIIIMGICVGTFLVAFMQMYIASLTSLI